MNEPNFWADATVISYTRAEALADGVLIEVPIYNSRMLGFTVPVAMTDTVHRTFVDKLISLLLAVRAAISLAQGKTDRVDFKHTDSDGNEHDLYALCHPGDEGEPVITIMFIGED